MGASSPGRGPPSGAEALAREATELIASGAAHESRLRRSAQLQTRLQEVLICYRRAGDLEAIWGGIEAVVRRGLVEDGRP